MSPTQPHQHRFDETNPKEGKSSLPNDIGLLTRNVPPQHPNDFASIKETANNLHVKDQTRNHNGNQPQNRAREPFTAEAILVNNDTTDQQYQDGFPVAQVHAAAEDQSKKSSGQRTQVSWKALIAGLCVLVLLVGVAVTATLLLSSRDSASPTPTAPINTSAPSPASPLTIAPTVSAAGLRRQQITRRIVAVSGNPAVQVGTPQYRALRWLIDVDTRTADDSRLIQRYIMVLLYFSTGGPYWTTSTGFLSSADECFWSGVTCVDDSIRELRLSRRNMTGQIPFEISSLSLLTRLSMVQNYFTGSIPDTVADMVFLRSILLYESEMTGSIPEGVADLEELQVLNLYENKFTGTVPSRLGSLRNLRTCWLNNNQLTGMLPPMPWGSSAMQKLDFADNAGLTGTIYTEFGTLLQLTELYLEGNRLHGTIPTELGTLTKLENLFLHENDLSGFVDPFICNLRNTTLSNKTLERLSVDCLPSADGVPKVECSCCTSCGRS